MAAMRSLSLLLSRAGLVAGTSAALIPSPPMVVLKVPAIVRDIATVNLWNPSTQRSHCWPSQIASIPSATVDIVTDHATFLANFGGIAFAFTTRATVRRW
jgi:hypothetical protein